MIENFYFLMMLDLSFRARGNMPSPSANLPARSDAGLILGAAVPSLRMANPGAGAGAGMLDGDARPVNDRFLKQGAYVHGQMRLWCAHA